MSSLPSWSCEQRPRPTILFANDPVSWPFRPLSELRLTARRGRGSIAPVGRTVSAASAVSPAKP